MTRLYGSNQGRRGWRRPTKNCGCTKIPYPSEMAALDAAARQSVDFEMPFRAYKCPGTSIWHTASRGFRPEALKSRSRIVAWHLSARRVMSWDGLLRELGLDPPAARKA